MLDPKDIIDGLILTGALEVTAIDSDSGQLVYSVTEKMEEVAPEIYKEINDQIHRDVMSLWQKNLLVVDILSDRPEVCPTEEGLDRGNWINLSDSEYSTMNSVMRLFEGGI